MNIEILSNNLEIKYYKNVINYCKKSNIEHLKFEKKSLEGLQIILSFFWDNQEPHQLNDDGTTI